MLKHIHQLMKLNNQFYPGRLSAFPWALPPAMTVRCSEMRYERPMAGCMKTSAPTIWRMARTGAVHDARSARVYRLNW